MPRIRAITSPGVQRGMWRATKKAEAMTRPKKKDQTRIGWLSSSPWMSLAREKMLAPIPRTRASRKLPLMAAQKASGPSLNSRRRLVGLIALRESMSSS